MRFGDGKEGVMLKGRAAVRLKKEAERGGEGSREAGFAFSGSCSPQGQAGILCAPRSGDISQTVEVDI